MRQKRLLQAFCLVPLGFLAGQHWCRRSFSLRPGAALSRDHDIITNQTILINQTDHDRCRYVLVNSQQGVGSSQFMTLVKESGLNVNNLLDRDSFKHKPATGFKHDRYRIRLGRLGCAARAVIILGEPVHSIESVYRRFKHKGLNKWRLRAKLQRYPKNITLQEVWAEMVETGRDTVGVSQYVQSWLAAATRSDWPPIRVVTTDELYEDIVDHARFLGVPESFLPKFAEIQGYRPRPRNTTAPASVVLMFDRFYASVRQRVEALEKARKTADRHH